MAEAYCYKCRTKRIMRKVKEMIGKNNSRILKGNCYECDSGMFLQLGKIS